MHFAMERLEVELCALADLRDGRFTAWNDVLRDEVTVLKDRESLRVFSSVCPHFGGEFDFDVSKGTARCRWHAWEFDLASGKCLSYPRMKTCLRHYNFEVRGEKVVVRVEQ